MNTATFILLGATGDLATTRLIPALYALICHKKIDRFAIVGAAIEETSAVKILQRSKSYIEECDEAVWRKIENNFFYKRLDFNQPQDFLHFADYLAKLEQEKRIPKNRMVYFSIASHFFCSVTEQLSRVEIIKKQPPHKEPWYRAVYEKPFGQDAETAHVLNVCIEKYLDESQVFRIDHYLAKDIVGNIALLRFTNRVLEPLWNKDNIAWVEIILSEKKGVEGRGGFYDQYGALKDVVQNHMLQILALIAMEAPIYLSGEFIRDEKARLLKKVRLVDALLGQYEGYREEEGVDPHSTTETFVALKLLIDNSRWKGVPFYLKTGKNLDAKETIINVQFKNVKCLLTESCPSLPNYLTIRVAPDPGFSLILNVKRPGMLVQVEPISMDFNYEDKFGKVLRNTYELLIQEVLKGEPSVSVRFDEIEYAWDVIDRIEKLDKTIHKYKKGSKGPEALEGFAAKHKMQWKI